jgi:hypothetical protein
MTESFTGLRHLGQVSSIKMVKDIAVSLRPLGELRTLNGVQPKFVKGLGRFATAPQSSGIMRAKKFHVQLFYRRSKCAI